MRLIVECEHGYMYAHRDCAGEKSSPTPTPSSPHWLRLRVLYRRHEMHGYVYQSVGWWPWKEAK